MSDFIKKPVNDHPEPKDKKIDADLPKGVSKEEQEEKHEQIKKDVKKVIAEDKKSAKSADDKKKDDRPKGRKAAKARALQALTGGKDPDELRDDRINDLKAASLLKESLEKEGKPVNDEAADYRPDHVKAAEEKDDKANK